MASFILSLAADTKQVAHYFGMRENIRAGHMYGIRDDQRLGLSKNISLIGFQSEKY